MSVLVGAHSRVLVQGMGKHGTFHAVGGREYGTNVVGGVTPGKGGTTVEGFALFNTVEEAVRKTAANVSMVFVPPPGAADAIMEAADAGIPLVVCITEGVPTLDMVRAAAFLATGALWAGLAAGSLCGWVARMVPAAAPPRLTKMAPASATLKLCPTVRPVARIPDAAPCSLGGAVPMIALVFGVWRLGEDLGFAGPFVISEGLFSHWIVWIMLSGGLKALATMATRNATREKSGQNARSFFIGNVLA